MRRKKIGTMDFHGSVDITDPCYNRDVWCRMTDVKIRKGVYTCIAWHHKDKGTFDSGEPYCYDVIGIIGIYLDGVIPCQKDMKEIGSIGVDAGLAGFFHNKPDYAPETDDFIKIGSQRFPLGKLKSRQEVLEYLRENGASHRALMDICGEYMEKYQNELCWCYPITDELHLGTFLLLVKEGVLSLPFNEVDSVDYELFCLEDACLCDAASINLLIADWYRFDSDLRHAMEGMRRHYEKKEAVGNENKAVSDRP